MSNFTLFEFQERVVQELIEHKNEFNFEHDFEHKNEFNFELKNELNFELKNEHDFEHENDLKLNSLLFNS